MHICGSEDGGKKIENNISIKRCESGLPVINLWSVICYQNSVVFCLFIAFQCGIFDFSSIFKWILDLFSRFYFNFELISLYWFDFTEWTLNIEHFQNMCDWITEMFNARKLREIKSNDFLMNQMVTAQGNSHSYLRLEKKQQQLQQMFAQYDIHHRMLIILNIHTRNV